MRFREVLQDSLIRIGFMLLTPAKVEGSFAAVMSVSCPLGI